MRAKLLVLAAVGVGLVLPSAAAAQSDWWDWALTAQAGGSTIRTSRGTVITVPRRDRDGDWRRDRDRDRDRDWRRDRDRNRARGGGPPFCRDGRGHPVHGRAWCREKGFGVYDRGYDDRIVWRRGSWDDVMLRSPRRYSLDATLRRAALVDILGDVVFGRIAAHGSRLGVDGPWLGRWHSGPGGASILQIRAGGIPIAELTDLDRDGRVDAILLNGGR